MVYGRRGSRVQPTSNAPTAVRIVEPASEESSSARSSFVDQGNLDAESQLEGRHPKKFSCRGVVTLLLKLWCCMRQQAHHLGVHFRVPETEDLFRLYSFRWQTPIMLYATLYIFIITATLSAIVLYSLEYNYGLLSGSISINQCFERKHCFGLLIYFFSTVLPNLMLLIFVIVAIKSKRQNCFVKLLRLGSILSTVLLTTAIIHVLDNVASNYLALIVVPLWLGMVMPLMELVWAPLLAIGTILLLWIVAERSTGGGQSLWTILLSAFLISLTHMVIHFCAVLLTLRHERETFKAVESATICHMESIMEDEKQERLLYSILPEHIALSIKSHLEQNALGSTTGRFRELYISSYDNVSILFADIKGFTAMASKCTAQQLAQTLNELYARFDIIAQKYHCTRIKLLGDCYYCVCGLPTPCEDHANCCVKMGLRMMDVIKLVNEGMGTDLAMRVGVHTGKVLCGVIGLHKWQFDIWSNDVTLANTLESGGVPGFVHISEQVYRLLGDEYDIIPGKGGTRNNAIKEMGITTYLVRTKTTDRTTPIECPPSPFLSPSPSPLPSPFHGDFTSLLKPQGPSLYKQRRSAGSVLSSSLVAASVSSFEQHVHLSPSSSTVLVLPQSTLIPTITLSPPDAAQTEHRRLTPPSAVHAMGLKKRAFADEFKQQVDQATQEGIDFLRMNMRVTENSALGDLTAEQEEHHSSEGEVLEALVEEKWNTMMMNTLKEEVERIGNWYTDSRFNKWTLQFKDMCAESEFLRRPNQHFIYYLVSLIVIHTVMYVIAQLTMPQTRLHLHLCYWISLLFYVYLAISFKSTNCTKYLQYPLLLVPGRRLRQGRHWRHGVVFSTYILLYLTHSIPLTDCCYECPLSLPLEGVSTMSARCDYSYMTLIILDIAITYVSLPWTDLTLTSQLVLGIMSRVANFVILPILFEDIFYNFFRTFQFPDLIAARITMFQLIAIHLLLSMASLAWVIMYWRQNQYKRRVQMLQEQAATTRRRHINVSQAKNQSLLLNIIPSYVASYYLSKYANSGDLFCQDHSDVAVMFASISGFDEFYGEDDINKHGLECLRLLNEIFSDFDELLATPQFQSVEKIKTIGATYMAAAGLVVDRAAPLEGKLTLLHQHLNDLVDLALVMTKALDEINTDSFQSFKLRIGIHHGPLVSGVIGAKKPQYDIWGDTVNTASRMESTGVPGKIQVAESTKELLEFHGFNFEYRGVVQMKGKGEVKTYFVAKKK